MPSDKEGWYLFRHHWNVLRIVGVYPTRKYNLLQTIHLAIVMVMSFWEAFTLATQLFFVETLRQFLNNIPMNACVLVCCFKFAVILTIRTKLLAAEDRLAQLYKRPMNIKQDAYLKSLEKWTLQVIVFLGFCYLSVNVSAAATAASSHRQQLLFGVWLPYEWRGTNVLYWFTFIQQCTSQFLLCMQNVVNDLNGPIYLIALNAHLSVVAERMSNLKRDPKKSETENFQCLVNCIEDHRVIMDIFSILQQAVSQIIFSQFVGTVIVFSMSACIYLYFSPSFTELMYIAFFMLSEILEILPCCYYSHQFMVTTDSLVTAIYSSDWIDQSMRYKKSMIIFMQMTQRPKVVIAGRMVPVTLWAFVSIMKMTYSAVALARQVRK